MPSEIHDDKVSTCVSFIRERLGAQCTSRPLMIGLNGMQGVGKTTLVTALAAALDAAGIHAVTCSIDDFYLKHEDQVALAREHSDNALLQHRGEPGTHDIALAASVLASLMQGEPTIIPQYDKGAFHGHGQRKPRSEWKPAEKAARVVFLEGWLVGFRPLTPEDVERKWSAPSRTLKNHRLEHLLLVNELLRGYDPLTNLFDAFIHIDSEDVEYVYSWRQEQEDDLRAQRGDPTAGMTPAQVVKFVDGYFPGYELYTNGVREGPLADRPGCQLRLVVGRDRQVTRVVRI